MECGDERLGERSMADELVDALGHFSRRLVGEGDGEDGVGGDAALIDQPGDAMGDDAGFARSSAGQNQHRSVDGFDRLALLGVQFVEEMLQEVRPLYSNRSCATDNDDYGAAGSDGTLEELRTHERSEERR